MHRRINPGPAIGAGAQGGVTTQAPARSQPPTYYCCRGELLSAESSHQPGAGARQGPAALVRRLSARPALVPDAQGQGCFAGSSLPPPFPCSCRMKIFGVGFCSKGVNCSLPRAAWTLPCRPVTLPRGAAPGWGPAWAQQSPAGHSQCQGHLSRATGSFSAGYAERDGEAERVRRTETV